MPRKLKPPVEGVVEYVSRNGTEVHLIGDPKRYRGYARPGWRAPRKDGGRTAPVFKWARVKVGDRVRLHWGGFADLNITRVQKLDREPKHPPTYDTALWQGVARVAVQWGLMTASHAKDCRCLTCEEIRMLVS